MGRLQIQIGATTKYFKSLILAVILLFSVQCFALDYLPDPSCADQNGTSCRKSIKNLLTAIGTTNKATIVLQSTKTTTTNYTVASNADWSAYTNVTFKIVPGAVFSGAFAITFPAGSVIPSTAFVSLAEAKVLIGTSDITLEINKSETVSADLTLVATTALNIGKGFILTIVNTKTLTINSPFDAGLYQVFSGTGSVVFGAGAVSKVFPEWFVTNTTPGTTDMTAGITAALASLPNGGVVKLAATTYKVSAITIPASYITLEGSGTPQYADSGLTRSVTKIKGSAANAIITNSKNYTSIKNMWVYGASVATYGISINSAYTSYADILVSGCTEDGIRVTKVSYATFDRVYCQGNKNGMYLRLRGGAYTTNYMSAASFRACDFSSNTERGFVIEGYGAYSTTWESCIFELNGKEGFYSFFDGVKDAGVVWFSSVLSFRGNHFEGNNTGGTTTHEMLFGVMGEEVASKIRLKNIEIVGNYFSPNDGVNDIGIGSPGEFTITGNTHLIYAGHYYVNIVYPSTKYPTGGDNYIDIITDTTQNMTTDVPAKTIVRADIGVSSRGVAATLAVTVFAADDATPSVCIGNFFKTANVNPTTITTLDGGYAGKKVVVLIGDAQTTVDFTGTALKGNGGADWSPGSIYDWMECVYDGTYWHCAVHESS